LKAAYKKIIEKANSQKRQTKKYLAGLQKRKIKNLDKLFKISHQKVFEKTNCLECANCCRSLGPLWTFADIERVAAYLKIPKRSFVQKYLRIDEDGDYVFKTMPCPFILEDNLCLIYAVRPKACREYPHSEQKNCASKLSLVAKNSLYCPALYEIIENIKQELSQG
jgi:Fe-S-cluster containining protein